MSLWRLRKRAIATVERRADWSAGFHVDIDHDGSTVLVHHEGKCGWTSEWSWRGQPSLSDLVETAFDHAKGCERAAHGSGVGLLRPTLYVDREPPQAR